VALTNLATRIRNIAYYSSVPSDKTTSMRRRFSLSPGVADRRYLPARPRISNAQSAAFTAAGGVGAPAASRATGVLLR
jgi:hypothetical protein